MANILLATHWTGGDVYPFIKLGEILNKRGHKVTLFTHCFYKEIALQQGMDFVPWDTPKEYQQMMSDLHLLADPVNNLQGVIEFHNKYHSKHKTLLEYKKLQPYCNTKDTVLVARHRSTISALLAAEKHQIPVLTVFLAPNYISHMQIHEQILGNVMTGSINEARLELGLKPIKSWTSWMCSPKRKLGFWPEWFAQPDNTWPEGIISVGFCTETSKEPTNDIPNEIKEMLMEPQKPILITAGTSKMIHPKFYKVASDACELLGKNGILVTAHDELVPQNLPDKILHFRQLPVKDLMPRMGAIIHHGGIGTSSEAVLAGIPQLILPHLTDGPDNAFRLRELGLAQMLPPIRWKSDLLAQKLTSIMEPAFIKKCREFSEYAAKQRNEETMYKAIEEVISNDSFLMIHNSDDMVTGPEGDQESDLPTYESSRIKESISDEKRQLLAQLLRMKKAGRNETYG